MNDIIKTFNNSEFGSVRTLTIDNEPWFVGKDVASILGYAKTENAIANHVDNEDKTSTLIQGSGSNYKSKTILINESGLYSLIFGSKLETAKAFKRWVTSEVLPTIRKTGSYTAPMPAKPAPAATSIVAIAVNDIGETASRLESIFALKHGMALATAIEMTQREHTVDLTPLKKLVPAEEYPGYMNPTQVGKKLGDLRPVQVNKLLEEIGLQYKDPDTKCWRLTEDGKEYGEEKPYTNHGHSGYSIAWNDLVIKVLEYKLNN